MFQAFNNKSPFDKFDEHVTERTEWEARGGEIYVVKAVAAGGGEDDAQHCP